MCEDRCGRPCRPLCSLPRPRLRPPRPTSAPDRPGPGCSRVHCACRSVRPRLPLSQLHASRRRVWPVRLRPPLRSVRRSRRPHRLHFAEPSVEPTRVPARGQDLRAVPRHVAARVPPPLQSEEQALRVARGRSTRSQARGRRRAPRRGALGIARTREALPPGCRRRREPPSDAGIPFREMVLARSFARPTSPLPMHHLSASTHRPARSARGHAYRRVHAASPLPMSPPHRGGRAGERVMRPAWPLSSPRSGPPPRALAPPPAPPLSPQ